ncbi:MAG TPA: DM13 domain-containing protein [Patescibacteria group bacterium]|nr:DM13 domain-containing protein [Patescibacteria group bacterium]
MELLGELERAFATSLYPLRVPIAIGLVGAAVAFIWFAHRRGWFAAARRHPARTTVLGAFLIAVGAPIGWYLGSPLFIRTALVEPAPSIAPGPSSTVDPFPTDVPASAPASSAAPTAPRPSPSPEARTGTFTGADDFHFGRGRATLLETTPGSWVVRFEDFSVRNGPDLYVYLSPDPTGYAKGAIELGRLKATDGDFNTRVPPGTDVTGLKSVVIWCKQFAVQFAVAPLG